MKAFVIIPFNPNFDDIYQIGIKETAKSLNVEAYRLDEELFDEGMLDKIYSEIENLSVSPTSSNPYPSIISFLSINLWMEPVPSVCS